MHPDWNTDSTAASNASAVDPLCSGAHRLIEFLSEITFDRFAQKFIDADLFFLALGERILADVPAVEVQSTGAVAQLSDADRIEPA